MNFSGNFWKTSCLLVALALPASADTFTLKDGSTLEGRILREDATSYVLEVQVTKSIKDERTVAKEDVVKIQREQMDLIAFVPISKFVPTPDYLTADDYAARIATVEKFLKEHGGSAKAKQVRAIHKSLKEEANEILAGGIKAKGKIVSAADYSANMLDIDAGMHEARIRALLKEGQYVAALRAFSEFDRDFRNTNSRDALLPAILQTINGYLAQTTQSLATYEARLKEREIGLQRMQPDDRRKTQIALDEEAAALEIRLKAEKDAKVGWVTTHPFYKPSLEQTMTFGKQEINRLTAATTPPAVDAGTAFRDSLRKIHNSTDPAEKSAAITDAKSAMVPAKYLVILEAAAALPR